MTLSLNIQQQHRSGSSKNRATAALPASSSTLPVKQTPSEEGALIPCEPSHSCTLLLLRSPPGSHYAYTFPDKVWGSYFPWKVDFHSYDYRVRLHLISWTHQPWCCILCSLHVNDQRVSETSENLLFPLQPQKQQSADVWGCTMFSMFTELIGAKRGLISCTIESCQSIIAGIWS